MQDKWLCHNSLILEYIYNSEWPSTFLYIKFSELTFTINKIQKAYTD